MATNLNIDPTRLRILANKIEELQRAKDFNRFKPSTGDIKISWNFGSSCEGYKEATTMLARVVEKHFTQLWIEALADTEDALDDLQKSLSGIVEKIKE